MNIHSIINYRLKALNITRYRMAKEIDSTPANFYRFLNGERRTISADKMVTLAEKIGLSNYLSLFELEKPKDLINYIDIHSKQSSFLKVLFYLGLMYDYHYYNITDVHEIVDNLSDTINNFFSSESHLDANSVLQYVADYLLYSKSESSPIIELFINERFSNVIKQYVEFEKFTAFHDSLEISVNSFLNEAERLMEYQDYDYEDYNDSIGLNIPEPIKAAQLQCAYSWKVDIYYYYLCEKISLEQAIQKLDELEQITEEFDIETFGDFDFLFYQMFNGEIVELPIPIKNFNNITNRTRNIALYSKFVSQGIELSLYHYQKPYRISYRETNNQIIGVQVNDDGVSKILPKNTFALVELEAKISNGDYALISINNNDAIIARIHLLSEKILVMYNSHYKDRYQDKTYIADEITIFGKVIEGISLM